MCNQISKPNFTTEQIAECKQCKHISSKQTWCCLFGAWIVGRDESRIIQPSRKVIDPTKVGSGSCCGKKKSVLQTGRNIITGWGNLLLGREKELADKRTPICNQCDKRKGWFCSLCKCPIIVMVRAPDKHCRMGKF
jgi:hypothetical protein